MSKEFQMEKKPQSPAAPTGLPQRRCANEHELKTVPPIVHEVLCSPGQPLGTETRAFFEPRFGYDFSQVRLHTDAKAAESAQAVCAPGYTVGQDVVFDSGQYLPESGEGRLLLAHELTHVIQQRGHPRGQNTQSFLQNNLAAENEAVSISNHINNPSEKTQVKVAGRCRESLMRYGNIYSPEQRAAMSVGDIKGSAADFDIERANSMQPGDVIFRLGSRTLARVINETFTHGGIYLGGGIVHDVVSFGNRTVSLSRFFGAEISEATDRDRAGVVRFIGPQSKLIVERLLKNIRSRNFRMPSDPVPFNLFSSADDYHTATCLEFCHAQFLHAINELSLDDTVSPSIRRELLNIYFNPDTRIQRDLITARTLSEESRVSSDICLDPHGGRAACAGSSISPWLTTRLYMGGADALAKDVDPLLFANRWEGRYSVEERTYGNWFPTVERIYRESINTFTYSSFVDSKRFFTEVQ